MNRILYEVNFAGNIQRWLVLLSGVIILIIGVAVQRKNDKIKEEERILTTIVMIAFIAINAIGVVVGCVGTLIPYKKGHYVEIEGVIQDYHSNLGSTRGTIESFTLDGVKFECSDGNIWGYAPNRKNGGVICGNGQHLRIRYIPKTSENTIVYIEQMMPEEWETD